MAEMHWTAYMTAFTAPVVASMAIYIAWRQWQTAREKLRLELFDRRTKVHDSLLGTIAKILDGKGFDASDDPEFQNAIYSSQWLFGSEVKDYLISFFRNAVELRVVVGKDSERSDPVGSSEVLLRRDELWRWFAQQPAHIETLFMPYLDFRDLVGRRRWGRKA